MNRIPEIITAPEAQRRGMRPLTYPYAPEEHELLDRVLRDFAKSPERPVALVRANSASMEVWVEPIPAMAAMAMNGGAE